MKKYVFIAIILVVIVSCSPYKSSYTEPEKFVANIPEVFWGNWVVDNDEFVNTMHFDIEKEHIWQWVENFEDDDPNDVTAHYWDKEDVTEKSFNPSAYNPPFGDIGYEEDCFSYYSKSHTYSGYTLMLHYDSTQDRIKLWMYHTGSYKVTKEFTYYLERAPKTEE